MSNSVPKTKEEILATYGTVKQSDSGSGWYLANDCGRATSGAFYHHAATEAMLYNIEKRLWRSVQRIKNRGKSHIVRWA